MHQAKPDQAKSSLSETRSIIYNIRHDLILTTKTKTELTTNKNIVLTGPTFIGQIQFLGMRIQIQRSPLHFLSYEVTTFIKFASDYSNIIIETDLNSS